MRALRVRIICNYCANGDPTVCGICVFILRGKTRIALCDRSFEAASRDMMCPTLKYFVCNSYAHSVSCSIVSASKFGESSCGCDNRDQETSKIVLHQATHAPTFSTIWRKQRAVGNIVIWSGPALPPTFHWATFGWGGGVENGVKHALQSIYHNIALFWCNDNAKGCKQNLNFVEGTRSPYWTPWQSHPENDYFNTLPHIYSLNYLSVCNLHAVHPFTLHFCPLASHFHNHAYIDKQLSPYPVLCRRAWIEIVVRPRNEPFSVSLKRWMGCARLVVRFIFNIARDMRVKQHSMLARQCKRTEQWKSHRTVWEWMENIRENRV